MYSFERVMGIVGSGGRVSSAEVEVFVDGFDEFSAGSVCSLTIYFDERYGAWKISAKLCSVF